MASVDLAQTHLKAPHVVAIVAAIISAGLVIGRAYMNVAWEVRDLALAQKDIPTRKDLSQLRTDLSSELTHAAAERVRFYMEHAQLECDSAGRHKQICKLVWPPPSND